MKAIGYYFHYLTCIFRFGFWDFLLNKKRFKKFTSQVINYGIDGNLALKSEHLKQLELKEITSDVKYTNKLSFENWSFRQGNLTLYELFCVCTIVKAFTPSKIFEIGTFDGLTTLHLALSSSDNCEIHTLDLPKEEIGNIDFTLAGGDKELVMKEGFEIGSQYRNHPAAKKITQHYSDSAKFEFEKYLNEFNLVFIDGAHSYDYVRSDTENSLKMVKPGGIILWHDYGSVLDVTDYLNDLSKSMDICRIRNTSLAYHKAAHES